MNAKQIADELENIYWIQGDGKGKPFQQYADFVRQQQAEIEDLKTCLIVEQEHNELMVEDRSKYEALAHAGGVEVGKELKTLTDEEILDVEKRLRNNGDFCELHFARAILRKAQEKWKLKKLN